jgi:hypothetical protein
MKKKYLPEYFPKHQGAQFFQNQAILSNIKQQNRVSKFYETV